VIGSQQQSESIDSLNLRPFLRTLSYREYTTSISLGFLSMAILAILEHYGFWLNSEYLIFIISFMPIGHIVYKIEHKRSNNFVGRVLHDTGFIFIFFILKFIWIKMKREQFHFDLDNVIFNFFLFIILLLIYEVIIGVIKRGLKISGWQIL
jgi:hypothetical protein